MRTARFDTEHIEIGEEEITEKKKGLQAHPSLNEGYIL
jgi:hypothetical protein